VQDGAASFLIARGGAFRWSPGGYSKTEAPLKQALLLTPPSTLRAFAAGYRVVLHPTASAA